MSSEHSIPRERLLNEFPPTPQEAWKTAAEALLKGAPFDKRMFSRTHEGITLRPIYTRTDPPGSSGSSDPGLPGDFPFRRGAMSVGAERASWMVAQELPYPTYEQFNAAAREGLEKGQNALFLALDRASRLAEDPDLAPPGTVGSNGASIASIAGFGKALDGIDISGLPLFVEAGCAGPLYLAIAVAHARRKKLSPSTLRGCIGSDPLGTLVQEGRLSFPLEVIYDEMAVAAEWAEKNAPAVRTMAVSSRPYADGGASAVEEIGVALATATAYVRTLVQRGIHPEAAVMQVWFSFTLGPQFFMEIAKLRAARMVWAHVASAFGVSTGSCAMAMHVRTSAYDMTTIDPYVNMLRATTEALSGAIGGCQSMHVGPFDEPVRLPDDFSRRIARNVHVLLRSESYIDRVVDPAGGSWYVESLTGELAAAAWKFFQEIERAGGMEAALVGGMVQDRIAATAARRNDALAHRRDVMVGVSTFANPLEVPLEPRAEDLDAVRARRAETLRSLRTVPDRAEETAVKERLSKIMETGRDSIMNALIEAAAQGATIGEMGRAWRARRGGGMIEAPCILSHRRSVPYEELRSASNAYARQAGHPPKVFLVTMGPLAQHKARADFSSDFVAAAGCLAQTGTGYATPEEAVDAAVASGAPAVVLCSTDETYPAIVPDFCALMKARSPSTMILLAGYPQEHIESYTEAGIEEFIHVRADVIAVLHHMLERMGVIA